MAGLSPFMQQYKRIKAENPDTILFFRLGDFYEMFFEDAELVSKELDLTLTGRDCGLEERAPMCGVPYHSCETYIARLIAKGYKVAICEQTEDPATAKGLVRREIVRVITPGTVTESAMLQEGASNYLASVFTLHDECAVTFVDTSTGQLFLTTLPAGDRQTERLTDELSRFAPSEIIMNASSVNDELIRFIGQRLGCCYGVMDEEKFDPSAFLSLVLDHFHVDKPEDLRIASGSAALYAVAAALDYLFDTQMTNLANINTVDIYSDSEYMRLDASARRNLELFANNRAGGKKGSLVWVLDRTKTAMGRRLLTLWLEQPLVQIAMIERRQHAVGELVQKTTLCAELGDALKGIDDLERLMTRVVYRTASPRDVLALGRTATRMPPLRALLQNGACDYLRQIYRDLDDLQDIAELVERAIDPDAPALLKDGGFIRTGYSKELDQIRQDKNGGRELIAEVEKREQERTGIKNLRVKYNKVFGYYIEITNSYKHLTPDDYIRKQTTTNAERYITQELKDLEQRVLTANDRSIQLEHELFNQVRNCIAEQLERVQRTAKAIAALDVLRSFADVALANHYTCPALSRDGRILITQGRHPVVETISEMPFVPNDCTLDRADNRCAIITGPNMAGKSTYMRQVALITIMAQIGSFVPAASAHIGVVDAVFTRVGASDDLFSGQSTFMVEMSEVANILRNATPNSLLILDEIGRGTSTYDGMAIARAVLEYVTSKKLGAKTLFATHYHELTEMADSMPGVKNYNVAVKKRGDDITFLRRIVPGGADRSYGVEVAALAGVPKEVVRRAKVILAHLEDGKQAPVAPAAAAPEGAMQLTFNSMPDHPVIRKLKETDVNTLTPIEAMNLLYELSKMIDSPQ